MRILRSIVAPSTALMAFCDFKLTGCSPISAQVIRDELVWDKAVFLQKLAHQFECRPLVASGLDENVEHFTLGRHGTPEVRVRSAAFHPSRHGTQADEPQWLVWVSFAGSRPSGRSPVCLRSLSNWRAAATTDWPSKKHPGVTSAGTRQQCRIIRDLPYTERLAGYRELQLGTPPGEQARKKRGSITMIKSELVGRKRDVR